MDARLQIEIDAYGRMKDVYTKWQVGMECFLIVHFRNSCIIHNKRLNLFQFSSLLTPSVVSFHMYIMWKRNLNSSSQVSRKSQKKERAHSMSTCSNCLLFNSISLPLFLPFRKSHNVASLSISYELIFNF